MRKIKKICLALFALGISHASLASGITASSVGVGNLFSIKAQLAVHISLYKPKENKPYPSIEALTEHTETPWVEGAMLFRDNGKEYVYFKDTVKPDISVLRDDVKSMASFKVYQGVCEVINLKYEEFHCAKVTGTFSPDLEPESGKVSVGEEVYVWMEI
tara:strand:+ start:1798 stop:2274 length:477 start_codon:yes stop_codon:yes gene_type:complete